MSSKSFSPITTLMASLLACIHHQCAWWCTMVALFFSLAPMTLPLMKAWQLPHAKTCPAKTCPDIMVNSKHTKPPYTWNFIFFKAGRHAAKLCSMVHMQMMPPKEPAIPTLSMRRLSGICPASNTIKCLHTSQLQISLGHTQTNFKSSDVSQGHTTSLPRVMQGQSSMHHGSSITMRPMVWEKLNECLKEIIVPLTEPTGWVFLHTYSWKVDGKLWVCLDPKNVNATICHGHYNTPTAEEITHKIVT